MSLLRYFCIVLTLIFGVFGVCGSMYPDAMVRFSTSQAVHTFVTPVPIALHDAILRFLGSGVRFFRDTYSSATDARVKIIWIDDTALAPSSLGGQGSLANWDRRIYVDLFRRLERLGAGGVALDILMTKNGNNDEALVDYLSQAHLPIVLATTGSPLVVDPIYFSGQTLTGSVDITRAVADQSDLVEGYKPGSMSLAGALAQSIGYDDLSAQTFLYEPKIEGVSIGCLLFDKASNPGCPPPAWYRGAYFIVATSAIAMNDMFPTAYGWAYGGEMHAWALARMIQGNVQDPLPLLIILTWWVFSFSVYIGSYLRPHKILIGGALGCGFFGVIFVILLWSYGYYSPSLVWWVLSSLIVLSLLTMYLWWVALHKSIYLRGLLGGYLSQELAHTLMYHSDRGALDQSLQLSPKKIITLFADIQDFTTISESLEFDRLKTFLDWYTDKVSEIFLRHGGYIDKFLGDGVMVLWGAVDILVTPVDEAQRVMCAVDEIQSLLIDQETYVISLLGQGVRMRFGISYGLALVGSVGDIQKKQSYTAFGDAINTASRLEGANKFYGTYILYSEEFSQLLPSDTHSYFVDRVCLKGKKESIAIYTSMTVSESVRPILASLEQYMRGGNFYQNQGSNLKDLDILAAHLPTGWLKRWRTLIFGDEEAIYYFSEK